MSVDGQVVAAINICVHPPSFMRHENTEISSPETEEVWKLAPFPLEVFWEKQPNPSTLEISSLTLTRLLCFHKVSISGCEQELPNAVL